MGKTRYKYRTSKKNKSCRRRRRIQNAKSCKKYKGGLILGNLLKSNGFEMPDDITQRLFDNAIKIIDNNPKILFKYSSKIAKIAIAVKSKCMIIHDDIEKFKCGYRIISSIISEDNEKEIKSIFVQYIRENKHDIETVLHEHNIKGFESILDNPEMIHKLDRRELDEIFNEI